MKFEEPVDLTSSVFSFMRAVECTTSEVNYRQIALYIGLQLEELAEKLSAIGIGDHEGAHYMRGLSWRMKQGHFDNLIRDYADLEEMLDADIDLAWVSLGAAFSQGADVRGAVAEISRSNLGKIGSDGVVLRDENGKVKKPEGWTPPNLKPFVKEK